MEAKEAGWCQHLEVLGFYKPNGSTAFKIRAEGYVYAWWINPTVMVLMCEQCYRKENPFITLTEGPLRGDCKQSHLN